ncbi:hypothetical protein ACTJK3_02705 [Pseudomonas sp. 22105]|jgi:hypothetical protein|uniref:hypothetical protein n=1 Tax=Pseudomonas TaxID=286 RepID=UPI00131F25D0|nr:MULTISPECIES: hypothetical protein [Pseudomonas]NKF27213.1 hypothetical protein [Pseudomonas sp. BG5]
MTPTKEEFLNHLAESRRTVEQWPSWKQEALKASPQQHSSSSAPSAQHKEKR